LRWLDMVSFRTDRFRSGVRHSRVGHSGARNNKAARFCLPVEGSPKAAAGDEGLATPPGGAHDFRTPAPRCELVKARSYSGRRVALPRGPDSGERGAIVPALRTLSRHICQPLFWAPSGAPRSQARKPGWPFTSTVRGRT